MNRLNPKIKDCESPLEGHASRKRELFLSPSRLPWKIKVKRSAERARSTLGDTSHNAWKRFIPEPRSPFIDPSNRVSLREGREREERKIARGKRKFLFESRLSEFAFFYMLAASSVRTICHYSVQRHGMYTRLPQSSHVPPRFSPQRENPFNVHSNSVAFL